MKVGRWDISGGSSDGLRVSIQLMFHDEALNSNMCVRLDDVLPAALRWSRTS